MLKDASNQLSGTEAHHVRIRHKSKGQSVKHKECLLCVLIPRHHLKVLDLDHWFGRPRELYQS